jgi:hypothetical protein
VVHLSCILDLLVIGDINRRCRLSRVCHLLSRRKLGLLP